MSDYKLITVDEHDAKAFQADLAFLHPPPSHSAAKLGGGRTCFADLCFGRLNCQTADLSSQHEAIRHRRLLKQEQGSGCLSELPQTPRTVCLSVNHCHERVRPHQHLHETKSHVNTNTTVSTIKLPRAD